MAHDMPGTDLIWIDQWEYQCCGTPLRCGTTVDLTLQEFSAAGWLPPTDHFSGGHGPFHLSATHHGLVPDGHNVRVRIGRLWEVRADAVRDADTIPDTGTGAWTLVPGSLEITPVLTMEPRDDAWQPATHGGPPAGWVLQASVVASLPPLRDGIPYGLTARPRLVRTDEEFPRLRDGLSRPSPRPGNIAQAPDGPTTADPWLVAWQPDARHDQPGGLVYGHPCLAVRADEQECQVLCLACRDGLQLLPTPQRTEDFVIVPPAEFLYRVGRLVASSWRGFDDPSLTARMSDYEHLFPKGIPAWL